MLPGLRQLFLVYSVRAGFNFAERGSTQQSDLTEIYVR